MANNMTPEEFIDKLSELIDSRLGANGGARGRFTPNIGDSNFSIDDLDKRISDYKRTINGLDNDKSLTNVEKYYKAKEKVVELNKELLELEDKINQSLVERDALLEKQKSEPLTEEEIKRLEEVNRLIDEHKDKSQELVGVHKELKGQNAFKAISSDIKGINGSIRETKNFLMDLISPYRKLNAAASQYSKTIGLTGAGMKDLTNRLNNTSLNRDMQMKYNMTDVEMFKFQTSYSQGSSRAVRVSDDDWENIGAAQLVAGPEKAAKMLSQLENFGVNATDSAQKFGKYWDEATRNGLSFEKYSDNVVNNIKMAQNYTFKNGIKGLENMAKKAATMKLDMQQVANFANQVNTVEGAIQTSAKLQVLGGPFAQLADPIGMLNEGLNDMEALTDRVVKMIGGLGSFDKETGEVRVSSFNRVRINEAAKAMGMDPSAIMESVHAQGRRNEIAKQMRGTVAEGFDKDLQELIKNTGTFQDGKAGISVRGKFTALEDLDPKKADEIKKQLQKETQSESDDIKDIAQSVRSLDDKFSGFNKLWDSLKSNIFGPLAEFLGTAIEWLGEHKGLLKTVIIIASLIGAGKLLSGLGKGLFRGGKSLVNIGKKGWSGAKNIFSGRASGAGSKITSSVGKLPKGTKLNSAGRLIDAKTGKYVSMGNTTKVGGGKVATSKIVKGGVGRTLKRGAIKVGGKGLGKIATKLGTAAVKGGGVASIATVAGALGDIGTDYLVDSGKIKKGGAAHHAMSAGSNLLAGAGTGAAIGAALGSFIPGIGNAVGAAAGAVIGGTVGVVKGLWKSGAIQQAYGSVKSFAKKSMDKIKNTKVGKAVGNVYNKVKNSALGKAVGKIFGSDKPKAKPKPKPKPPKPRSSSLEILNGYTAKIKPVLEKGTINTAGAVAKANNNVHVTTDPHDINLNGTINLKGENGQSVNLISELKHNPQMLRNLTDMVSNEMGVIAKGGNIVQRV